MPGIDIRLNAQNYLLKPREDGSKILTRPVQQFVNSIKDTGRTRPEDVSPYETFIHPNLTHGFGRYRINSDRAFDPNEYKRFWDSTLDTRWQDAVYLPILAETAGIDHSPTDTVDMSVIKASTSFKGELSALWTGPGGTIQHRRFNGVSTTLAEALDGSETGVDVADASSLAVNDVITVDSEKMLITAISTNTLTVTREVSGTSAAIHSDGATVTTNNWPKIFTSAKPLAPIIAPHGSGAIHQSTASSYTFNVTISVGTDLLVAVLFGRDGSAPPDDPDSITIGGDAMTKAIANTQGNNYVAIYYKAGPDTGTVEFTTSWLNTSDANIDEPSFVFYNVEGINVSATVDNAASSDMSSTVNVSNTVTTEIGDVVIDGYAVGDDVTNTLGADQIVGGSIAATDSITHVSSYQVATSTSTAMTHTMSEAESGASAAVGFAIIPSVPLDLTHDRGNLIALLAREDDHIVMTSSDSDNAVWSVATTQLTAGLLSDSVTVDENIDAGLFATIGGELIACLWDEGTGVTFFRSTNGGVVWADEAVDIPSANGPQGVAVYPDIDGEDKLYVGTSEGLYIVDTSPSTWTYQLIMPMSNSTDNCRRMTVHEGSLWFAQGVDNDSQHRSTS